MSSTGQISSMICKNFAQNAWKKDLCSNCFKSEVEHQDSLISGGSLAAHVNSMNNSVKEDNKWKTSTTHPNLLSQTNGNSNQSSIKALNNINQTIVNKSNKSVNDCQNTTTTILQSSKKSVNSCNLSPQILLNTKKINSTHVLSQNMSEICIKMSDKPQKDTIKDNNLNTNSINNCLELRKVINSKHMNGEENNCLINSSNKTLNNNNNNKVTTKDPKQQNFPQLSTTKDKLILSQTNLKNINSVKSSKTLTEISALSLNNNNNITDQKTTPLTNSTVINKTMPLIGILRSETNRDLIKYRKKNKCLVFKEGDPMIIGIDSSVGDFASDDEYSEEEPEEEEEESDFDDDEQIYYSDDKELRELTRINTKFNSNFANFSINSLIDDKIKNRENPPIVKPIVPVVNSEIVLQGDECDLPLQNVVKELSKGETIINEQNRSENQINIPEVCEKLVEKSLIETFEEINDSNSGLSRESIKSLSPDSSNSDILPMSTSSDSYSSSSGDEKEDSLHSEEKTRDIENLKTHLINTQNVKPVLESNHLGRDSESDNWSSNSDSGLEIKDYESKEEVVKQQNRIKPQLPVKPNISTIVMNSTTICVENKPKTVHFSVLQLDNKSFQDEEEDEEEDNKSVAKLIDGELYHEICETTEDMIGTEGKFSFKLETNNNLMINEKPMDLEFKSVNDVKRDIKLAELAQELEQVRHMKRPAPQPPTIKQITEITAKEDIKLEVRLNSEKQSINTTNIITEQKISTYSSTSNTTSSSPTKPHRFSIRKLLHKKSSSEKIISVKTRDHSNESERSVNSSDYSGADRKAWKQSEFDRTNLKILHPIDLTKNNDINDMNTNIIQNTEPIPLQRPEAPPRTPKPNRPSVPVRRRKQSVHPHLQQPRGEPPPPPPPTTPPPLLSSISSNLTIRGQTVEQNKNDLNEAYNQLAKSNYFNLLAIKSKIESIYEDNNHKWTDFEVTNPITMGSTLLYKDSIVSKSDKSVHLLVLPDCYCAPLVTRFRHHSELVLVLDEKWTEFEMLSEMCLKSEPKLNSLILQLYLILEKLERNGSNQLDKDLIDKIIICSSKDDCLLVVPHNSSQSCLSTKSLTLHQFLAQVLVKLLADSVFGSLDSQLLSRPSVPLSHSKTIVQMIVFQIPVHQMSDKESEQQINYWFDINRSKFINQFCCLSVDTTKLLTLLDYNYLNFLCNDDIELIRSSMALLVNTSINTINC